MRKLGFLLGLILAVAVVGVAFADASVSLSPANEANCPAAKCDTASGVSGTAQLVDKGDGTTEVIVKVTGEPTGASEPAHIHVGQCGATLGAVKYPLKNVENGTSDTVVNAKLSDLQTGG